MPSKHCCALSTLLWRRSRSTDGWRGKNGTPCKPAAGADVLCESADDDHRFRSAAVSPGLLYPSHWRFAVLTGPCTSRRGTPHIRPLPLDNGIPAAHTPGDRHPIPALGTGKSASTGYITKHGRDGPYRVIRKTR
jgi:hypothetical protein